jgi:hypothetical protein
LSGSHGISSQNTLLAASGHGSALHLSVTALSVKKALIGS